MIDKLKNPYVLGGVGIAAILGYFMLRNAEGESVPIASVPYDPELARLGMETSLERERLNVEANTALSLASIEAENVRMGISSAREQTLAALATEREIALAGFNNSVLLKDRDVLIQQGVNDAMVRQREIDANAAIEQAKYARDAQIGVAKASKRKGLSFDGFSLSF